MSAKAEMIETIAGELFKHRLVVVDGRSQCKCGWWVAPLLDSLHRLHQAESVLTATLLATAQITAENIAESRSQLDQEWQTRYAALEQALRNELA